LRDKLSRILEETAFMLVEDPDAPLPAPGPAIEARLPFAGRVQGTCWLAVSESGSQHLANEMLGDELDPQSQHCEHATAELLNILTAWVLDAWWGASVPHEMGTPSTARRDFDETVVWSLPPDQRAVVATDSGHTFICGVTVEG
jgi:hypothetical protein